MTPAEGILLANAASTWVMVGVIWFVQLVHYPLFAAYAPERFAAVARRHQTRTTWVVFPPMAVELVTSLALLVERPPGAPAWAAWLGAALVGVWGFSTALVQVPLHERLAAGFDTAVHARLVRTNWLRTAAWTAHGAVCAGMLAGRSPA